MSSTLLSVNCEALSKASALLRNASGQRVAPFRPQLNAGALSQASSRQQQQSRTYTVAALRSHHARISSTSAFALAASPACTFTTTSALSKKAAKGGKKSRDAELAPASTAKSQASSSPGGEDPYDFSELQESISQAASKLKDDLSKLRTGGRFNTDSLESLRVHLVKGSKDSTRLGDVAQVIPKGGRSISLLVGEEEHIKPITSAIQASTLSLTPQPDPHNGLQLNIPIPPPTAESRAATVTAAKTALDKAALAVRNARGVQQKRLRALGLKKIVRPDDLKKAGDMMEKVAERGQTEVKNVHDAAKKALESA